MLIFFRLIDASFRRWRWQHSELKLFFLNLAVKQRGFLIGTNFGADARLDTVNVCMSSVVNVRSCPHVRLDGGKCDMV